MYRSTPSCQATSVVARSSRIAPLGAIRPPQAAAGSACVRKSARVAAAAGTSLLTIGNLLFRRIRHLSDADGPGKFPGDGIDPLVGGGLRPFEGVNRLHDLDPDGRGFPGESLAIGRHTDDVAVVVWDRQLGPDLLH